MFKFRFHKSDDEQSDDDQTLSKQWYEAKEILDDVTKTYECDSTKIFECDNIKIKYVSSNEVINKLKEDSSNYNSIVRAETNHSDLLTAEYEGGMKIWECTYDLISYLSTENILLTDKKVLDLGCGAGLLGIYTLLKGATVDFQDYNEEVIKYTTIPNVVLNSKEKLKWCKFFSGDWRSFINLTKIKYDIILTSETIYNPENFQKLIDVFNHLLKESGTISKKKVINNLTKVNRYLAAKTYYFGVGGGTRQFENLLDLSGVFTSSVCWNNSEGVQREIIKIVKK